MFSLLSIVFVVLWSVAVGADSYHVPLNQFQTTNPNTAYRTYGVDAPQRRQITSSVPLTNQGHDIEYLATISVGTPAQQLRVTIGLGTVAFWLASTACTSCDSSTPRFNSSASSTFRTVPGGQVAIFYASGNVTGQLSSDRVSLGEFTVPGQVFVAANQTSLGLIDPPSSGVLGFAFSGLSTAVGTTLWESLLDANRFSVPMFALWITRFNNDSSAAYLEPGGVLTLGGTNSSLYTGDIEFIDMPVVSTQRFWQLLMTGFSINGNQITITHSTALSAFDIGSTLIGGPSTDVRRILAAVPGAVALNGTNLGFWALPCATPLDATITFGGKAWPISGDDLKFRGNLQVPGTCYAGIYEYDTLLGYTPSLDYPNWVIGAAFLKNVYSVYRATPPSVGFARLSRLAGGTDLPTTSSTFDIQETSTSEVPRGMQRSYAQSTRGVGLSHWANCFVILAIIVVSCPVLF